MDEDNLIGTTRRRPVGVLIAWPACWDPSAAAALWVFSNTLESSHMMDLLPSHSYSLLSTLKSQPTSIIICRMSYDDHLFKLFLPTLLSSLRRSNKPRHTRETETTKEFFRTHINSNNSGISADSINVNWLIIGAQNQSLLSQVLCQLNHVYEYNIFFHFISFKIWNNILFQLKMFQKRI